MIEQKVEEMKQTGRPLRQAKEQSLTKMLKCTKLEDLEDKHLTLGDS